MTARPLQGAILGTGDSEEPEKKEKGHKMSAKDLIARWEEALGGVLEREPVGPKLSKEDLELTAALPRVRSSLRAGANNEDNSLLFAPRSDRYW